MTPPEMGLLRGSALAGPRGLGRARGTRATSDGFCHPPHFFLPNFGFIEHC